MKGAKETVSGFTAKLSKKAASLLNSGLKHKAFKANQKLGSFSLTLTSRATLVTKPLRRRPGAPGHPRRDVARRRPGVHAGVRERPGLQRAERHAPRARPPTPSSAG